MRGRQFSRDFKLQVIRQAASGERRPVQLCREYNLSNTILTRWRAEYAERGELAFGTYQENELGYWQTVAPRAGSRTLMIVAAPHLCPTVAPRARKLA